MFTPKLHVDVYSSFIHNRQNLEAAAGPSVGERIKTVITRQYDVIWCLKRKRKKLSWPV